MNTSHWNVTVAISGGCSAGVQRATFHALCGRRGLRCNHTTTWSVALWLEDNACFLASHLPSKGRHQFRIENRTLETTLTKIRDPIRHALCLYGTEKDSWEHQGNMVSSATDNLEVAACKVFFRANRRHGLSIQTLRISVLSLISIVFKLLGIKRRLILVILWRAAFN